MIQQQSPDADVYLPLDVLMNPCWESHLDCTETAGQLFSSWKHRTYKSTRMPHPYLFQQLPMVNPHSKFMTLKESHEASGNSMKGKFRGYQVLLKLPPSFRQYSFVSGLSSFHTLKQFAFGCSPRPRVPQDQVWVCSFQNEEPSFLVYPAHIPQHLQKPTSFHA